MGNRSIWRDLLLDRKELRKRWIMGTIQPEVFYIPWKKKKEHCVFIWAIYWELSENYPTIQDKKENNQYHSYDYETGFVIYDDKGNKVSNFSFGVFLPSGKYYAIQYCSTYSLDTRKISFPCAKIAFEVKDTDDDIYLYIDVSSRKYTLSVKFKPEQCEQIRTRYKVTQKCYFDNGDVEERPASVTELEYAYLEEEQEVIRDVIIDLELYKATDNDESWTGEYTVAKAKEKRLWSNHYNDNYLYPNSLSKHPKIKLSKEIERNTSQKYKVYFDIKEENNLYACIDYTFNYFCMCGYNYYGWYSSGSDIWERQYLTADKSWFTQNGFFTDETGGLSIVNDKDNNTHMLISNGNINGYKDTKELLPDTYKSSMIGYPVEQYLNLDQSAWLHNTSSTQYMIRNASYANTLSLSTTPDKLYSYTGDEWHHTRLRSYIGNPLNDQRTSFVCYNETYDTKYTLNDNEIFDIYNSENVIVPENGLDFIDENFADRGGILSWFNGICSSLSYNGNTSVTYRPFISSSEMKQCGYNINIGKYVSFYNDWAILPEYYYDRNNYETGLRYVVIHYTPIRGDGTVLTKEQMKQYINIICSENQKSVSDDNKKYSTSLKYEDNRVENNGSGRYLYMYQLIAAYIEYPDITSDEYNNYCSGQFSDKINKIINIENQRREQITNLSEKWNELYLKEYPDTDLSSVNRYDPGYLELF